MPAKRQHAPVVIEPANSQRSSARRARPVPAATGLRIEPVQPSYVQVAAQLRSLILGGQLQPGERLPSEADLSAQFGVSRSTTREALRLLAAENLLETRRGVAGGAFVVHPDPADLELSLSTAVSLAARTDRLSMGEVFEVWEITQVPAAGLAARRRTDNHVARLFELSGSISRSRGSVATLVLRAIDFHNVVLDAATNRLLAMVARPLNGIAAGSLAGDDTAPEFVAEANERHRLIAQAIADRDELAARAAMAHDMSQPAIHHHLDERSSGV